MSHVPISVPTGVHLRGATYHLRIGVPKDIRHLWPKLPNGKPTADAYRASLRTSDRNEAAAKAHAIIAEYQRKFAQLSVDAQPIPYASITDELVAYIVQKTEQTILAMDDVLRHNPEYFAQLYGTRRWKGYLTGRAVNPSWEKTGRSLTPEQFGDVERIHNEITLELKTDLSLGNLDAAQQQAEFACAALAKSLRVDWTTDDGRTALQKVLRAMVRAWEGVRNRNKGEPIETPTAPIVPVFSKPEEPAAPAMTLREVVPLWAQHRSANAEAIKRTNRALDLFEQAVGKLPLKELTRATGARFVRFLLDADARGFGNTTAKHQGTCIAALLNVAVEEELIEKIPFTIKIDRSVGAKRRGPWTDDQFKLMYSHALFSECMNDTPRWHDVDPADGRALLLILQHTGARIGEIAQLRREDFQMHSGLVSIRITAEAGKVKTQESERDVPLAEHLLNDPWFTKWLAGVMGGSGNAMPTLCGRARGPGDTAGQWFRQFRAAAGLPPGELEGAHKFRHWIRTALAEVNVSTETADSITGHSATGSSGRKDYTARAGRKVMKEALDRLAYPATFRGG
ncbi:DUF6538 domain-containing protein [Paraburkholderia acidicola]|uniref:DUF6538 domain-containing protein n=1 Tax=Paraburkholderia acidicola TaxID=1912599 RepID=UPI0032DFB440